MKIFIFLILFLLFSCEKKSTILPTKTAEKHQEKTIENISPEDFLISQPWFQYYKKENPDFKPKLFQLQETAPISYNETSTIILNKKGFNEVYKPFLIFNKGGTHYLDIDSYQWFLNPDGSAGFEADQQIVLVDLKKKEAQQIGFFGPSFWIEDAYWKGDSVAVLVGNSSNKIPFILKFNFAKNTKKYYKYSDTLRFETAYSKIRLRKKGIKIE